MVGYGILGGAFGVTEIVAPRAFLDWRARMARGAPALHVKVAAALDRMTLPDEQASASNRYLKLRLFGLCLLLLIGLMETAMALLMSAFGLF